MSSTSQPRKRKLCFVTVGATAPFQPLVHAALRPPFLSALAAAGYSDLRVQHGELDNRRVMAQAFPDAKPTVSREGLRSFAAATAPLASVRDRDFDEDAESLKRFESLEVVTEQGLRVSTFPFRPDLERDLSAVRALDGAFREEGCLVCHAGTGTVLEALRQAVAAVVVPNPALLDNHQADLAAELDRQGYIVNCELPNAGKTSATLDQINADSKTLAVALTKAETLRARLRGWPPVNSGEKPTTAAGIIGTRDSPFFDVLHEEVGFRGLD